MFFSVYHNVWSSSDFAIFLYALLFMYLLPKFCLGNLRANFHLPMFAHTITVWSFSMLLKLPQWPFFIRSAEEWNLLSAKCSPSPWSCQSGDSVYRSRCPYPRPCDGGFQWCRSPVPGFHPFHFLGHHLLPWGQKGIFRKLWEKTRKPRKQSSGKMYRSLGITLILQCANILAFLHVKK